MTHILWNRVAGERAASIERVLQAALAAADPRAAVRRSLEGLRHAPDQALDLDAYRRIRVVGAGKAAQAMARGLLDVLGERLSEGLLITKHVETDQPLPERLRVLTGAHPVPAPESVSAARAVQDFLSGGSPDDLVFCLISGGGSALMVAPRPPVTLDDLQALTRLLLACGADIGEINTLRKHLDLVKGGGVARAAAPARLVTLILSDVIGSPLDVIASGPTEADPTTYADALAVLDKYQITPRTPQRILETLRMGQAGEIPETIKPGDALLEGVTNLLVASNPQAAQAALEQAAQEGFHTLLLTTFLQGEAREAGGVLASILRQIDATGQPLARPACIVAGGETTVTLRGQGLGGRNQELALGALVGLADLPGAALLALGTDGEDGPAPSSGAAAAGALVTGESLARARALGLDPLAYLSANDSYHFFEALGDLLITGPTGTNVNDLAFLFAF
jgi:hydroxypyruvate reductase